MKDPAGHVTTGLITAIGYLKDNRLLPHGFDKQTAEKAVAVYGGAPNDPNFTGGGDRVRYSMPIHNANGPLHIEAELWYQPIGYRWANSLKPYDKAEEPRRFNAYFDSMDANSAVLLAHAEVDIRGR
jgi:hypothetical protein